MTFPKRDTQNFLLTTTLPMKNWFLPGSMRTALVNPTEWSSELEFGHPVIDGQHRELAALTNSLKSLFKEAVEPANLVSALTEYCRLLSDHFSLEHGLMEELPQEKYQSHIQSHRQHHQAMILFVEQAIKDVTQGAETSEIVAEMPVVFAKLRHNIIFDDAELSTYLLQENILRSTK